MDSMSTILFLSSHFLIGLYFIFFGVWNIYHWAPMIDRLVKKHFPSPVLLLSIGIGWQFLCGLMIMFGVLVQLAAILLIPLIIAITLLLHPFWQFSGELKKQHMALFVTQFTLSLGALILLLA